MKSNIQEKPIKGYSNYLATSQGLIISLKHGKRKIMSQCDNNDGYKKVNIIPDGANKGRSFPVHRLIAETFLKKRKKGNSVLNIVNHKNGKKDDNRIENLEWTDRKGNARHYENHIKPRNLKNKTKDIYKKIELLTNVKSQVNDQEFSQIFDILVKSR